MKTILKNECLTELSETEYVAIAGGESGWYWLSYGAGVAYRQVEGAYQDTLIYMRMNIVAINPVI